MRNIVKKDEFSLVYFNGTRSHAILKTVGEGDFRVQEKHGGGVVAVETPDRALVTVSNAAMDPVPFKTLHARVDLVRTDAGSFAFMELRLIESCLNFRFGSGSAGGFARAICVAI